MRVADTMTSSRRILSSLVIATAVVIASPAHATGPAPHIIEIDDIGKEQIDLIISDSDTSLDRDDISVMINGTQVPATIEPLPQRELDIVIATGAASDDLRRALQGALFEFAMQVLPSTDLAIDSADAGAFTSDTAQVVRRIRELATEPPLAPVVDDALTMPSAPDTDRALIVVGDQNELRAALGGRPAPEQGRDDVSVFPIAVGEDTEQPLIQQFASASGGWALQLDKATQLTGALDRIASDLFNRYRIQATLPAGVAPSNPDLQVATPTGVSQVVPVSLVQPVREEAAAAGGDIAPTIAPYRPFVTGNLLAVLGLSVIPIVGFMLVGFTTVRARRRQTRQTTAVAVVDDEIGDDVRAAQRALEGLRRAMDTDADHAAAVRMTEAVASVSLDDPGAQLESFLIGRATATHSDSTAAMQRLITALDDSTTQDVRDSDIPRTAAKLLGVDAAIIRRANSTHTTAHDTPPLLHIASEHAEIAGGSTNAGQVARLITVLRVARSCGLASPTLALSRTLCDDQPAYRDALDESTDDAVAWTRYLLQAIAREATRSQRALTNMRTVHDAWVSHLDTTRRGRFPAFVESLFTQPLVTARHVADAMDISHQGALNLIRRAEKRDWLSDYGRFGRGGRRHWVAKGIIEALEGADPNDTDGQLPHHVPQT